MYYEMPAITSPIDLLTWANTVTNHYFGPCVCLALFAVIFLALKRYDTEKAFASASFITAIVCFLMYIINLTTIHQVVVAGIAVLVSVFALHYGEGGI